MHLGAGLIGLPLHFTVPIYCMFGMFCNLTEFTFLVQLMESVRRKVSGADSWGVLIDMLNEGRLESKSNEPPLGQTIL
jgi:hypothetical protein